MARALASRLGYRYIDSGAMYRAVTLYAIRNNLQNDKEALIKALPSINIDFVRNESGTQDTLLNNENVESEIRSMAVSDLVSTIAAIPQVRQAMVSKQQKFGISKGIVMDGRDIGTTVFPNAELKIFVDASPETRARRRFEELQAKGDTSTTFEKVLANIKDRDYADSHREESPLRKAKDAIVLNNSEMDIEEQNRWLDEAVRKQMLTDSEN